MTNDLMLVPNHQSLVEQAKLLIASGMLPRHITKPEQLIMIAMKGQELGLPPLASVELIVPINGVPAIRPQGMIALVMRSGQLEDLKVEDDGEACTVTVKRKGVETPYTTSFSMTDARQMMTTEWDKATNSKRLIPLAEKYNWQQMPAVMRKWRALAAAFRVMFPDFVAGLYTTEELGDSTPIDDDTEWQAAVSIARAEEERGPNVDEADPPAIPIRAVTVKSRARAKPKKDEPEASADPAQQNNYAEGEVVEQAAASQNSSEGWITRKSAQRLVEYAQSKWFTDDGETFACILAALDLKGVARSFNEFVYVLKGFKGTPQQAKEAVDAFNPNSLEGMGSERPPDLWGKNGRRARGR